MRNPTGSVLRTFLALSLVTIAWLASSGLSPSLSRPRPLSRLRLPPWAHPTPSPSTRAPSQPHRVGRPPRRGPDLRVYYQGEHGSPSPISASPCPHLPAAPWWNSGACASPPVISGLDPVSLMAANIATDWMRRP